MIQETGRSTQNDNGQHEDLDLPPDAVNPSPHLSFDRQPDPAESNSRFW